MSAEQIVFWWSVWLALAGVIVLAAAVLLLTIIGLAHRIGKLAGTALAVVDEIEAHTQPIWELNTTNRVAGDMAVGAEAIAVNTETIAAALTQSGSRGDAGAPPGA